MRVQVSPRAQNYSKRLDFNGKENYLFNSKRYFKLMRTAILLFFIVSLCVLATAEVIKLTSLQAQSDGSVITLGWNTEDETGVTRFIIERRVGTSGPFVQIAAVDPKGPSVYDYTDKTAFRSTATLYQYQIRIKFANGTSDQEIGPISVSHSVNSVKRTWGSIKAMFR
jgi:hypothetical protein